MTTDPLIELGYAHPLVTHPRQYILDEMIERDWAPEELCRRLGEGDDSGMNALGWCLYFSTYDSGVRLGVEEARDLARVFGTSPEFWLALQREWLARIGDSR